MTLSQDQFASFMDEHFSPLVGHVGVFVKRIDTGDTYEYKAHDRVPTASTMKLPLLYEMYRQADAGELDISERISLDEFPKVPGSGVLQHMDPGMTLTVRDVAELMTIVSDNMATDILYGILGTEKIAAMLSGLGATSTFLPLTIRRMLCQLAGEDATDEGYDYDRARAALQTNRPGEDNPGFALDETNDISTPADLVRIMEAVELGEDLTNASRDAAITILKHQNFSTMIPGRLPLDAGIETAHKTGSLRGIRNDVGMVYSPSLSYAIAFMSRGLDDPAEGVARIALASRWIWDRLSEGE